MLECWKMSENAGKYLEMLGKMLGKCLKLPENIGKCSECDGNLMITMIFGETIE